MRLNFVDLSSSFQYYHSEVYINIHNKKMWFVCNCHLYVCNDFRNSVKRHIILSIYIQIFHFGTEAFYISLPAYVKDSIKTAVQRRKKQATSAFFHSPKDC